VLTFSNVAIRGGVEAAWIFGNSQHAVSGAKLATANDIRWPSVVSHKEAR
jgi:hypothetical protein